MNFEGKVTFIIMEVDVFIHLLVLDKDLILEIVMRFLSLIICFLKGP
jgi:hypothetical protein